MRKKINKSLDKEINKNLFEDINVINMTVRDDSNFLSVFSSNDTFIISDEVANFIENSTHIFRPDKEVILKIKSNCIDNNEKELYKKAIKEYYTQKYVSNKIELKKNYFIATILTIIGIVILIFALFLEYMKDSLVWSEVIDIAAWVFLWEAVDIFFLQTRKLKNDCKKYLAYMSMNIEFYEI